MTHCDPFGICIKRLAAAAAAVRLTINHETPPGGVSYVLLRCELQPERKWVTL